ncbi:MAG: hypothetical protein H0W09_01870 [Solirubrobacterales bacterium]|nr:hypothetical protein [Solirubrobacterales bacterium]
MADPPLRALNLPAALRLDIGLPSSVDLLHQHDLDNYLFPLVSHLGSNRFASAWATKATGPTSSIPIEAAKGVRPDGMGLMYRVVTHGSAEKAAWKREIRDQIAAAEPLRDGAVERQLAFAVGASRNWANLWKAAIDSLDPILGRERPDREWNPRDGRVTRLGLHREVKPALGYDVEIAIAARALGPAT